jgi:CRP-like cAMP-binding protein/Zn-dependent protease
VLAAIVVAAAVVAIDSLREKARLRRQVNVREAVASKLDALPGTLDIGLALSRATAAAAATRITLKDGEIVLPGIYERLAAILNPDTFRPRLASGVELKEFELRWGNDYAIIASPDHGTHLYLQPWEADVASRMDGSRTTQELIVDHLRENGDLDPGVVLGLVEILRTEGFLEPRTVDVSKALQAHLDPASPGRRKLREFGRTQKIAWDGADEFVKWTHRTLRVLWFPPVAIFAVLFALAGLAAFVTVEQSGRVVLSPHAASIETLLLLSLSFILTFAHELGHALVLTHYKRKVISAGFFIFFGSPAFFVEAADGLMLDRRERILQSFAGPFAELLLAGIASMILFFFPDARITPLLYRFAVLNYFVIFLNLIPLLELDGYWILTDVIQVPDLRRRSLTFIQSDIWAKLRRRDRFSLQEVGLGLYGFVGIAFTIVSFYTGIYFWREIFGGLVVSLWHGGIGSRILLGLLALVFIGPVIRGLLAAARALARRLKAIADRVRFRMEESWRVEAAELIDALPAFDDLPEDVLSDLAGRVKLRTIRPGYAVFRAGDRGDAFYVVRSGEVTVEDEDPGTGDVQVLRTLGRGESFGELGLLEAAPRKATVRAVGYAELFVVDKATFDRLLADSINAPSFGPTMQAFAELRALSSFRTLSSEDLSELLEHGSWITIVPGEDLISQGETGDAFFAIENGQVDVIRDGTTVATLGPGQHFGEVALLEDLPRNATVRARTPLRAFRLDHVGFDHVVAASFRRTGGDRTYGRDMEH